MAMDSPIFRGGAIEYTGHVEAGQLDHSTAEPESSAREPLLDPLTLADFFYRATEPDGLDSRSPDGLGDADDDFEDPDRPECPAPSRGRKRGPPSKRISEKQRRDEFKAHLNTLVEIIPGMETHSATRKSVIVCTRDYVEQLQLRERILRAQLIEQQARERALTHAFIQHGIGPEDVVDAFLAVTDSARFEDMAVEVEEMVAEELERIRRVTGSKTGKQRLGQSKEALGAPRKAPRRPRATSNATHTSTDSISSSSLGTSSMEIPPICGFTGLPSVPTNFRYAHPNQKLEPISPIFTPAPELIPVRFPSSAFAPNFGLQQQQPREDPSFWVPSRFGSGDQFMRR